MIGMLGENLVYGVVSITAEEQHLDVLYIVDPELNVLKEYTVPGGYITEASVDGDLLEIFRQGDNQENMSVDYILYNQNDSQNIGTVNVRNDQRKQETWLVTNEYGNDMPVVLFARAIESYRNTQMEFQAQRE